MARRRDDMIDDEPLDRRPDDHATRGGAAAGGAVMGSAVGVGPAGAAADVERLEEGERTIELLEEQLVAHKEMRDLGEVVVRKRVEEVPGRVEVEAYREEVEVEHVPVGEFVNERRQPWEEGDVLVVPVYEEQLVVSKRLMLKEHLRIRRVGAVETRVYEDTLRRERLEIEDPTGMDVVHEQFPPGRPRDDGADGGPRTRSSREDEGREDTGFLGSLVRKALQ